MRLASSRSYFARSSSYLLFHYNSVCPINSLNVLLSFVFKSPFDSPTINLISGYLRTLKYISKYKSVLLGFHISLLKSKKQIYRCVYCPTVGVNSCHLYRVQSSNLTRHEAFFWNNTILLNYVYKRETETLGEAKRNSCQFDCWVDQPFHSESLE